MKLAFPSRGSVLLLAVALSMAALSGCADVRQAPTGSVVNGQADAATQVADVPPPRQSSIPF
jgi:hypothetical protein